MKKLRTVNLAATLVVLSVLQALAGDTVPVTVDNFVRAESDLYFDGATKKFGFGEFGFESEMAPIDEQTVIRMNRDTLYSRGGIRSRCRAGDHHPARCRQALHVDADHQRGPIYADGCLRRRQPHADQGRRSARATVIAAVRILVDPNDPEDLEASPRAPGRHQVRPNRRSGKFEVPNWDQASQKKVRDALLVLASHPSRLQGRRSARKEEVDPVRHLIGAAAAWGGNPTRMRSTSTSRPARTTARPSTGLSQRRSGRRLLVDQRLQRQRLLRGRTRTMPIR